jgi:hypothetical protein
MLFRLSLVSSVSTSFSSLFLSQHDDPCVRLCEEFSADRRGAGYNLCDHESLSQCVRGVDGTETCTNLYWSTTEEGEVGLVYDTVPSDDPPVLCYGAAITAGVMSSLFERGLEIFANFDVVRERLANNASNPFLVDLTNYTRTVQTDPPAYSAIRTLYDHVRFDEATNVIEMIQALSEAARSRESTAEMTEIFVDTQIINDRRCADCGNLYVVECRVDHVVVTASNPRLGVRMRLSDLLNAEFRSPIHGQSSCPDCYHRTPYIGMNRLGNPGTVFIVHIVFPEEEEEEPGSVNIPQELDLSQYMSGTPVPTLRYELVAISSTPLSTSYVRTPNNEWNLVQGTGIAMVDIDDPPEPIIARTGTYDTFFYQRVTE